MKGADTRAQESGAFVDPFAFRTLTSSGREVAVDPFQYRGEAVEFGSFIVFPNITLQQEYNDNVFATEGDEEGDFVTVIEPELILRKDIGRHEFILNLSTEFRQHWDLTSENVENIAGNFRANIEAKKGINIPVEVSYRDGYLARQPRNRLSEDELTIEPLETKSLDLETGIVYKPRRLLLSLLGNYRAARPENGLLTSGATLIRDNRELNTIGGRLRAGYDVTENFSPFIDLTLAGEDFINEALGAVSRDNTLFRIRAGSSFDYRGLVTGRIGIGYEERSFEESVLDNTDALSLDGDVVWQPQEKTRLSLDFSRETFEDSILAAGLTQSFVGLNVRHELMRDLFLRSNLSYQLKEFEDFNREDEELETGIGALYIINPRFQIGADYRHINRKSTLGGLGGDNNIFMIRLRSAL